MSEILKPCPFCKGEFAFDFEIKKFRCDKCEATVLPDPYGRTVNNRPIEDDLIARIAELEAFRLWIPVSERLPELGKVVHVIGMNFIEYFTKTELVYETAVLVEVNGFKMFGFVNEFSVWSSSDVTHWMYAMPLPTPPEVQ